MSPGKKMISMNENPVEAIELNETDTVHEPVKFSEDSGNKAKSTDIIASKADIILSEIKDLKIEAVLFLYMFSAVMRSVSSTSMIIDKVCLFHLNYPEEICSNLGNYTDINIKVEKMANNYQVGHTLIQMLPAAILACFIGAWSDKYSRKLPIICGLFGITLDGLGATLCAGIFSSRVEYYLLSATFTGISGGVISVLTVLFSFASDVTSLEKRTMKYTFMEVAFGLSMPLGQLAGGWVFNYYGYVAVFLTSTAGSILTLALVIFLLKETRGLEIKESWKTKLRSLWSTDSVISSFKAAVKRRPNKGREQILLLIMAMSFALLNTSGGATISFMYVHHMYQWDNTTFSTVSAVFNVISTLAMLIAVPIFRRFKLNDPALGIVGTVSVLLKNVGTGLATSKGVYFLSNLLGLFQGLSTLAGRARISKVASKSDLGKIFSFLITAEALLPILATSVVSQVFNATLSFFPGLIFLILGGLAMLPLGVYIWVAQLPPVNYEEMHKDYETANIPASTDSKIIVAPKK